MCAADGAHPVGHHRRPAAAGTGRAPSPSPGREPFVVAACGAAASLVAVTGLCAGYGADLYRHRYCRSAIRTIVLCAVAEPLGAGRFRGLVCVARTVDVRPVRSASAAVLERASASLVTGRAGRTLWWRAVAGHAVGSDCQSLCCRATGGCAALYQPAGRCLAGWQRSVCHGAGHGCAADRGGCYRGCVTAARRSLDEPCQAGLRRADAGGRSLDRAAGAAGIGVPVRMVAGVIDRGTIGAVRAYR